TAGNLRTVYHRYARSGDYTVRLTVSDDCGNQTTSSHKVTVAAPYVYAPTLIFHPKEKWFPASPDDFIRHSKLKWAGSNCPDSTTTSHPVARELASGRYKHKAATSHCRDYGRSYRSTDYTSPDQSGNPHHLPPPNQGMFLDVTNAGRRGMRGAS